MALRVHRCRFAAWTPSAVLCLAARPDSSEVALSRDDGSFELVDGDSRWATVGRVAGRRDLKTTAIVWCSGRWFASASNGVVFEVSFKSAALLGATDSMGGAVWGLESDPRSPARLAAVCDDGTLRLFDCDEALSYAGVLRAASGARALSMCWARLASERLAFVGCDDGTIRRVELSTGASSMRLTLERDNEEQVIVWCLVTVPGDEEQCCTVASGDSLGCVTLWDGGLGVQLRRFRRMDADVLCIVASVDRIFAAGVDAKVACFEGSDGDWAYASTHRAHVLDVRGLALVSSKGVTGLVSGSLDSKLCFTKLSKKQRAMRIWPFPHHAVLAIAKQNRVLAVSHSSRLDLYRLPSTDEEVELWLRLEMPAPHNLACFALQDGKDGIILAISDGVSSTRLMRVSTVSKKQAPKLIKTLPAALALHMTVDRLVLVSAAKVVVYDFNGLLEHELMLPCPGPMTRVALKGDFIALSAYCGEAHVARLSTEKFRCVSSVAARAMAFVGEALLVAHVDGTFAAFDCAAITDGNKAATQLAPLTSALAAAISTRKDGVLGLSVSDEEVVAYSHGFVVRARRDGQGLQITEESKDDDRRVKTKNKKKKKLSLMEKQREEQGEDGSTDKAGLSTRYTPLLAAAFLSDTELLVAENPWLAIASSQALRPIKRKRFGT